MSQLPDVGAWVLQPRRFSGHRFDDTWDTPAKGGPSADPWCSSDAFAPRQQSPRIAVRDAFCLLHSSFRPWRFAVKCTAMEFCRPTPTSTRKRDELEKMSAKSPIAGNRGCGCVAGGFTLVELLVVIAIIGFSWLCCFPRSSRPAKRPIARSASITCGSGGLPCTTTTTRSSCSPTARFPTAVRGQRQRSQDVRDRRVAVHGRAGRRRSV